MDKRKVNINKCCVVIPTHKEKLEGDDERSFIRALDIFGGHRDIIIIIPDDINDAYYKKYNVCIIKVPKKWMDTIKSYNRINCNKSFYLLFKEYDYMLLYETDAWVFEDKLDYFIELGYDWYGAPWPHHNDLVGNSGFSLRNISKMIDITSKYEYSPKDSLLGNCDTWFCITHKGDLNICDLDNACNFSMEIIRDKYLNKIKSHPMGLHGRDMRKYFWDNDGSKFEEYKNRILNGPNDI